MGRDLSDIMIIDNSPGCYRFNLRNAIPISSWFDDTSDKELLRLVPMLERLAICKDVRKSLDECWSKGELTVPPELYEDPFCAMRR